MVFRRTAACVDLISVQSILKEGKTAAGERNRLLARRAGQCYGLNCAIKVCQFANSVRGRLPMYSEATHKDPSVETTADE